MAKLFIKALVLVSAITILISISGNNSSNIVQAALVCDAKACWDKCTRSGYSAGWCVSGTCSCGYIPPPRD